MPVRPTPRPNERVDTILLVDRFDSGRRGRWLFAAVVVVAAAAVAVWGLGLGKARPARAPKPAAVTAAPGPAPSAPTSARARPARGDGCELDRCADLPFPDPAAVDPDQLFAEATRQARLVDAAAQLGGAMLQNVFTKGALNLTREGAIVRLSYDLPSGGLQVDATRARITVARFSRSYMDALSPEVPCSPKQALDAVSGRGFPITSETRGTLTVGSLAGRSRWSFRTRDASAVVEGPTCVVRDLSIGG